ncbi:hypothetical protein GCM10010384_34890 [Streptomyces djakartensis]|uniref:Uncharacterized protein n=1 Tax=Streptomyces djakartensis TaxID=68193 RepID=A0ABQ2ZWI1_9ACTN|nr:hypothetical protein GCM10010384_34890 [Streptomyces djakartensis]
MVPVQVGQHDAVRAGQLVHVGGRFRQASAEQPLPEVGVLSAVQEVRIREHSEPYP